MMEDNFLFSPLVILCSFFLTLKLTGIVREQLLRHSLLDVPNARSSHTRPVPRGGGWALLVVLGGALAGSSLLIDHGWQHVPLIVGVGVVAGISWLDDRGGVSASKRLSLHVLAASIGSLCFSADQYLLGGLLPYWLDRPLMIVGWAWFINLYNFMDGIDGITGVETISVAIGLCTVGQLIGLHDAFGTFITFVLIGTCLGFLAHNWHPAKIFMGDIGSIPLGYIVGFGLIDLAVHGYLAAAIILPLYYLADSGITLSKRALRGEKIWQAHRQHFYQKAALGAGRHDTVVMVIALANLGLILAAIASIYSASAGVGAAIVIVAILLQKMHKKASPSV